jgi:hypothetical protein
MLKWMTYASHLHYLGSLRVEPVHRALMLT